MFLQHTLSTLSNLQIKPLPNGLDRNKDIIPYILRNFEERFKQADYESANLILLNALKTFPNQQIFYEKYILFLDTVLSNIEDPEKILKILNDSETLTMKAISEVSPTQFASIKRFLDLLKETRAKYLETLYQRIQEKERNKSLEDANLMLRNYAYILATHDKLVSEIILMLRKRLEEESKKEEPSLSLAYETLEIAQTLRNNFKANHVSKDISDLDRLLNTLNDVVGIIEQKYSKRMVEKFFNELEEEKKVLSLQQDWVLFVIFQTLLRKAEQLANSPFVSDEIRREIFYRLYDFQNALQEEQTKRSKQKLREYNRWALDILKRYNESNKEQILNYALEIGKIDTSYLFPEVKIYYDHILSNIVNKLKDRRDIEMFVERMFRQEKKSP